MHQRRLMKLLLSPSLLSLSVGIIMALTIVTVSAWPIFTNDHRLSDHFYGQYGIVTILQQTPSIVNFVAAFSASPIIYNVLLIIVAGLFACGIYAALQIISHIVVESYDGYQALHASPSRNSAENDAGKGNATRVGIRLTSLILWIAYSYFFLSVIMPVSALTIREGAKEFVGWGMIKIFVCFLVLFIALHIHVVCLRLLALRPRIFGGKLAILLALYDADGASSAD